MNIYDSLRDRLEEIINVNGLSSEEIIIHSKALSPEEAIGITKRKDFPILTGKEIMLEANFKNAIGQAFTDSPTVFTGSLSDILKLDTKNDPHAKGIFIASLNAIMRYLDKTKGTIHCKNQDVEICAEKFVDYIKEHYGDPKIGLIGFQPALLDNLSKVFSLRVLDLNPDNIDKMKYGVFVEDGIKAYQDVVEWADLVLCTGSTICNGSVVNFIDIGKPVIFYGTTIAGAAEILGLKRLCFCSE